MLTLVRRIWFTRSMEYVIRTTWNGRPLPVEEYVGIQLHLDTTHLIIDVQSPYYDDPAPLAPAGQLHELWQFEVMEVFLLGERQRYLEVELAPHGHHLALALQGRRNIVEHHRDISYASRIEGDRWLGNARIPLRHLPRGLTAGNLSAIHGEGNRRTYLSYNRLGGSKPDFHRLQDFGPIDLS